MQRYNRNILIDGFGEEGQRKLKTARILIVGAGGLGSPVLLYLAAAGVGTLGIIDNDKVSPTNLQRQIIHFTSDLGIDKTTSAQNKIGELNPEVNIITYNEMLSVKNAFELINSYDFIIDCCDNYETKYLINDVCIQTGKPFSHGAVVAMRGEVMTVVPGSACYRCVFDNQPDKDAVPDSSQAGILGSVAGIVGSIQATEAIKYIVGVGELLIDKVLIIDARNMEFYSLKIKKKCIHNLNSCN